ncbi:MAG: hypothetical protein IJ164_00225 [Duodenibacillus sp.]|nr:hypothetical protein [Duodenibacillus sp.]
MSNDQSQFSRLERAGQLLSEDAAFTRLSARELLDQAARDPLLRIIPDENLMRVCIRRAKLVCHLMVSGGPDLSEDEQRLYDRLMVDGDFFVAIRKLLLTPPETSDEELPEAVPDSVFSDSTQSRWIRDLAAGFALVPHDALEEALKEVPEFFSDGLPFTSRRYVALLKLREDDPEIGRSPRTLN